MTARCSRRTLLGACVAAMVTPGRPADAREDPQALVDAATRTFIGMLADRNMGWLRANIETARGVLIAPRIVKAGFLVGGAGGPAVLVMKGRDGAWAGPVFYTLTAGSFGFQAGYSEAEAVTLVMTGRAADSLLAGSFRIGGDLSIATGPRGGGAHTNLRADLISFTRTRGLYGGVNLTGTGVGVDEERNAAFWGRPAITPVDILIARTIPPRPGAKALLDAVASAAARR
ncbi:lipid-binding SYLF domain-containing protein [Thermaurantiacus sp.]